jgi:hypothetical protein
MHTYWSNSQYRELGQLQKTKRATEYIIEFDKREDDFDIENEIDNDIQSGQYHAIVELYRAKQTKLEKQVVWDIYFVEKQNTARKFGAYIGKSRHVGAQYIKELKEDLKSFYDDYFKDKNNI